MPDGTVEKGGKKPKNPKDWVISGSVNVAMANDSINSGPLMSYSEQSLKKAKKKVYVDLIPDGVLVVNEALEQFIHSGGDLDLVITLCNSDVEPTPSVDNPLAFKWEAGITIQVVVGVNVSKLPPDFYSDLNSD